MYGYIIWGLTCMGTCERFMGTWEGFMGTCERFMGMWEGLTCMGTSYGD